MPDRIRARIFRSALVLLLLAAITPAAHAQYFGRNKVQWENFKFKILHTQHFDIGRQIDLQPLSFTRFQYVATSIRGDTRPVQDHFDERFDMSWGNLGKNAVPQIEDVPRSPFGGVEHGFCPLSKDR